MQSQEIQEKEFAAAAAAVARLKLASLEDGNDSDLSTSPSIMRLRCVSGAAPPSTLGHLARTSYVSPIVASYVAASSPARMLPSENLDPAPACRCDPRQLERQVTEAAEESELGSLSDEEDRVQQGEGRKRRTRPGLQ